METGFVLRDAAGAPYYSCVALEKLAHIRHGFSTRAGGPDSAGESSLNLGFVPWDPRDRVEANRKRFIAALGLDSTRLATLSQIHSDRVHIIEDAPDQGNRREGDALATRRAGICLGVVVADCFPILLSDLASGAVAAIHSGWRGTASRIAAKTVSTMSESLGSDPSRIVAAIGPGIRSCCFEVGGEVARQFTALDPGPPLVRPLKERRDKFMLDLPRALNTQLIRAGLLPERIFDLGLCTRCNPKEFFSHRAEGPRAGRQMAVIGIDD